MKKMVGRVGLAGFFALALVGVEGCDKTPAAAGGEGGAVATAADPGGLSVGKEIVASGSANSFTGGTVTAIEGMKVTYEYGEADKTTGKRYSSSVDKSKAVWCSSDRAKAWLDFALRKKAPAPATCDNPVESIVTLGQSLGVRATPTLFFENGERQQGGMQLADLRTRIDVASKEGRQAKAK